MKIENKIKLFLNENTNEDLFKTKKLKDKDLKV